MIGPQIIGAGNRPNSARLEMPSHTRAVQDRRRPQYRFSASCPTWCPVCHRGPRALAVIADLAPACHRGPGRLLSPWTSRLSGHLRPDPCSSSQTWPTAVIVTLAPWRSSWPWPPAVSVDLAPACHRRPGLFLSSRTRSGIHGQRGWHVMAWPERTVAPPTRMRRQHVMVWRHLHHPPEQLAPQGSPERHAE